MLKNIATKFIDQARHEGFVRFKDGNRINFCRYNLERVSLKTAINSINTFDITDWDASLTRNERVVVSTNKAAFIEQVEKISEYDNVLK